MKLSTVLSRVKKVTAPTQGQRPFVRRALTVDAIFSCLLSAAAWAVRLMLRDLCTFAHHPLSTGPKKHKSAMMELGPTRRSQEVLP